jgi:hypothetical protein
MISSKNRVLFRPGEHQRIRDNVSDMISCLEEAGTEEPNPSHMVRLTVLHRVSPTLRKGGRPRLVLDQDYLQRVLRSRGPAAIARAVGCSARTVRRRIRELNLVPPGQPVFAPHTGTRIESDGLRPTRHAPLSDEDLDYLVFSVLQIFPNYGRSMVAGQLASEGLVISRSRITRSLRRVRGVPLSYGRRKVNRKKYWVPAVNSLWHHDGQHGMGHPILVYTMSLPSL